MPINSLIRECTDCTTAITTLHEIDHTLADYGRNKYFNQSYLTQRAFPYNRVKLLTYYREIINNLIWNEGYYFPCFTLPTIISRVKVLTNGL